MSRIFFHAMLGIVACELLGGCAQTTAVPHDIAGGKMITELPPTTLPPGTRDGITVKVRALWLDPALVDSLPVQWNTPVAGTLRQAAGTPDQLERDAASKPTTFRTARVDDARLTQVIAAAEADRRAVLLAAPQFALLPGLPASVNLGEERQYVKHSGTKPEKPGTSPLPADWDVQTLRTGFTLNLTATPADNDIATAIHQNVTELQGIDTFTAPDGSFVQLPRVSLTDFTADARIGNGQTLVLVGPKVAGEAEIETKTPILGDLFGKPFTNHFYVRDERTLVLLISPTRIVPPPATQAPAANDVGLHDLTLRVGAVEQRHQKVAGLIADARTLYDAAKFKEAQDLLRQATIIDPQDANAALFLRIVNTKIADRDAAATQARTGTEVMRQNIDGAEHLAPYADVMTYPENWPEISRRRDGNSP